MARSSYIYIVIGVYGNVVHAFTVKYECINWILDENLLRKGAVQRWRDAGEFIDEKDVEVFLEEEGYT